MKEKAIRLTTSQFAKMHEVNKRTLHYYDSIGFFCPAEKGENGYRYYHISQSMDFEYIRMLKELHMSMDEIKNYRENPTPQQFLNIADRKEKEIDMEIQRLRRTKKILHTKKEQAIFCEGIPEQKICIEQCKKERLCVLPYDFSEEDLSGLFPYVKEKWGIEQIRMGIGGYISVDKIKKKDFEKYDGIYSVALTHDGSLQYGTKQEGMYLCGYQRGTWDRLPKLYENMLSYAEKEHLTLDGYAYEMGWNEFVISEPEQYMTKVMIKAAER